MLNTPVLVRSPKLSNIGRGRDEATTSTSQEVHERKFHNITYRDYIALTWAEPEKESLNRTSDPSTTADPSTINVAGIRISDSEEKEISHGTSE
ncbi:jg20902 [Pararge aegeria aegeria]|uniref:Jg20902 protein n=1 Tax=Pararge aegeria aegeria TaxID=348720 RepID=A0A8S4RJF1_9NEOP|nr:jg20902 [Pararge aegeria aegeria]